MKLTNHKKNDIELNSLSENHKESIKNNKLILKLQQRFRSEKHNVLTEKVNKIALSANDNKEYNRKICIWNKQRHNT